MALCPRLSSYLDTPLARWPNAYSRAGLFDLLDTHACQQRRPLRRVFFEDCSKSAYLGAFRDKSRSPSLRA